MPLDAPTKAAPARSRWRRWALEAGLLALVVIAVRAYQSTGAASGPAPSIPGIDLAGAPVELGSSDRPVLVHFMASWCGVCDAEEGNVVALARDHDVIAIASGSGDTETVRAWIATTELEDVRIIPDPDGEIARAWGVGAFPTGFYLDASGAIRHVEVGYTSELGMRVRMWLASL